MVTGADPGLGGWVVVLSVRTFKTNFIMSSPSEGGIDP